MLDKTHTEKRLLDLDSVNARITIETLLPTLLQSKKYPDSDDENSPHTDYKETVLE